MAGVLGCPAFICTSPVLNAGVQRAQPTAGGLGVSPRDLIIFPLPSRKGARGMVRATRLPRRCTPRNDSAAGSPEGCLPSGRRHGGCASIHHFALRFPFLLGRGPGGWSEPHLRQRSYNRNATVSSPATPDCFAALAMTGFGGNGGSGYPRGAPLRVLLRAGGVQRAQPFGRGLGVSPSFTTDCRAIYGMLVTYRMGFAPYCCL